MRSKARLPRSALLLLVPCLAWLAGGGGGRRTAAGDEFLGYSVANVGDLDGDGAPELLAGAPRFDYLKRGYVELYKGPNLNPIFRAEGPNLILNLNFGQDVAAAGDVDHDGTPDFIVGAPRYRYPSRPYARVYSGASGLVLRSWTRSCCFATHVAGVGDVNQDGHDDLAVTGYQKLEILSGLDGSLIREHPGETRFLADVGDLDGDLVDDFAALQTNPYGIHVYSGLGGQKLHFFPGNWDSVAGGRDLDGDGVPDLAVGWAWHGAQDRGQVQLLSGSDGSLIWDAAGWFPEQRIGICVALLEDYDGDGVPDVATAGVGRDQPPTVPGSVNLLSGADGRPLFTELAAAGGSADCAAAGDQDGDGLPDVFAGFPDADPAFVKLFLLPPLPSLTVPHFAPGQSFTLALLGGRPGAAVHFLYSLTGEGSSSWKGRALDLAPPVRLAGSATAGAEGLALLTRTVPAKAANFPRAWFQAVETLGGQDRITCVVLSRQK